MERQQNIFTHSVTKKHLKVKSKCIMKLSLLSFSILLGACQSTNNEINIAPEPEVQIPTTVTTWTLEDKARLCSARALEQRKASKTEGNEGSPATLPIVTVNPQYPIDAIRNQVEAKVYLSFDIDKQGKPSDVQVYELEMTHPQTMEASEQLSAFEQDFKAASNRAMSKWAYKPMMKNGEPQIDKCRQVTLTFAIHGSF